MSLGPGHSPGPSDIYELVEDSEPAWVLNTFG
jgi:hypothetical protein